MTTTGKCPFEHIHDLAEEQQQIAETAELTVKLLDKRYAPPKQMLRGVHPKSHGCVNASFSINNDLPPELQVGLFATPGKTYSAIIRFSNAEALVDKPDLNEDGEHGSRGMAIKIFDVGGDVLQTDGNANNQDFLMINQPVFAFANMRDYLRLNRILDQDKDIPNRFFAPLQLNSSSLTEEQKRHILDYIEAENITPEDIQHMAATAAIVNGIKTSKITPSVGNPLGAQYFSAAPFMFGDNKVMKFSAKPIAPVPPLSPPPAPAQDYLRAALTETMHGEESIEFDFMLQIREDISDVDLEIENASTHWPENAFPFVKVAKITIEAPQAEVTSASHVSKCENLVFTPWHALVEHQPIGSINRLRRAVYQASAEHRLQANSPTLPFFIRWIENAFKFLFG